MTPKFNSFIWHDLLTHNVRAAKRFYGRVFGWSYVLEAHDYHVTVVKGEGVGGIMLTPEYLLKLPPFWSPYVLTEDAERMCKRTSDLGGIIIRTPWDTPVGMRVAVIADPTGGVCNLLELLDGAQLQIPEEGAQGAVGWHELHTVDVTSAWKFYAKLFGWTKAADLDGYQQFEINGKVAGAIRQKRADLIRPMWLNYFNVRRVDAAMDRVNKAGGTLVGSPEPLPTGRTAFYAKDPQGGFFQAIGSST